MDGKGLLYQHRQILNENSGSDFLDDRTTYTFLYEAAVEFVNRTECLKATQSITTVADQTNYALEGDFLRPYLRDDNNELVIKYNNGNVSFIRHRPYDEIFIANNTTSATVPSSFSIIDRPAMYSRLTGTCTSAGALSNGEATLTDSAADFSNVVAGDLIHNTTDDSDGVVLSKTSSTVLVCALFGGTDNDWDSSDAYILQPQGRLDLVLDPPPSEAGDTITVPYIQRPAPVFAPYRAYRFQSHYMEPLVKYAVWLYKYRDREPNFGDAFYQIFERATRMNQHNTNRSLNRGGFRVNFKKRR